jgi:hypothetical protein
MGGNRKLAGARNVNYLENGWVDTAQTEIIRRVLNSRTTTAVQCAHVSLYIVEGQQFFAERTISFRR